MKMIPCDDRGVDDDTALTFHVASSIVSTVDPEMKRPTCYLRALLPSTSSAHVKDLLTIEHTDCFDQPFYHVSVSVIHPPLKVKTSPGQEQHLLRVI